MTVGRAPEKETTPPEEMSIVDSHEQTPDESMAETRKREGPDSRTVVLAPETKKQRVNHVKRLQQDLEFLRCWYLEYGKHHLIQIDYNPDWKTGYSLLTPEVRRMLYHDYEERRRKMPVLFSIAGRKDEPLRACLRTAHIYKVDKETNNIEEHQLSPENWHLIEEADYSELLQFVQEKAFKKVHRSKIDETMVQIDSIWVRKWKRYPDGSLKVKSRMCARGCFDQQKGELTTRSTTATRLSQRLIVSHAAQDRSRGLESIDIGGAFLKGFSFEEIQKTLKAKGHQAPTRVVIVFPPMNVWQHLASMSDDFKVANDDYSNYGLLALKPIYGLNDAPLAWQLNLHGFLKELGASQSHLDENAWFWKKENAGQSGTLSLLNCESAITTHLDDLGLSGTAKWREHMYNSFLTKYKKVTRQTLPFTHCGCEYEQTGDGYLIRQQEFAKKLEKAEIPKRDDSSRLTPEEVTLFRSILGALLWITATRLDVIADVSILQSRVTVAEIKDLKLANDTVDKVKEFADFGLHYRYFKTRHRRLVCVHDASAASKTRHYAQEGILIYLADDHWHDGMFESEHSCETAVDEMKHCGMMHLLFAHGAKAKRVSYSTSHGETLAMISTLEAGTLCMVRLSEMMHPKATPTLQDLIAIQEHGNASMPMDFYGDAKDVYELVTGSKTLPQDKTQRLYILAFREARLDGRCRMITLIPTECMISDSLTKSMTQLTMMQYLTTGLVEFYGVDKHPIISRTMPRIKSIDEHMLERGDDEIIREFRDRASKGSTSSYFLTTTRVERSENARDGERHDRVPAAPVAQEHRHSCSDATTAMDVLLVTIGATAILAILIEKIISGYWSIGRRQVQDRRQVPSLNLPASPRPSTAAKRQISTGHEHGSTTTAMEVDECFLGDTIEVLQAEKANLEQQRSKLNARCQNLLMEVTGLRRDLRAAHIKENQLVDQVSDLKRKNGRLEDELRSAECALDQGHNRWNGLEDELRTEIERLNRELHAHPPPNDVGGHHDAVVVTSGGSRWHKEGCTHARGGRTYFPCRVCSPRAAD